MFKGSSVKVQEISQKRKRTMEFNVKKFVGDAGTLFTRAVQVCKTIIISTLSSSIGVQYICTLFTTF